MRKLCVLFCYCYCLLIAKETPITTFYLGIRQRKRSVTISSLDTDKLLASLFLILIDRLRPDSVSCRRRRNVLHK